MALIMCIGQRTKLFKTFLSPFSISNAAPFLSRKSQPWKQISRVSFASSRTTIVLVINSMQTVPIFLVEGVRPCLEKFDTVGLLFTFDYPQFYSREKKRKSKIQISLLSSSSPLLLQRLKAGLL
ncbi:hypothetical protein E1A91_A05G361400v1 [Gossypium mustelinum]|uniref:Uncharacterized protein n=1 Tax=Gossypium mustelinum TaxID=34275 RepID=A0A5D2ZF79_GOSMU|nr:hypothetical protein E1A91_A05G361400v1 [Gossypium mustelinum]TYJ37211.1 hypothetical protein E1A91_A05G361400v1 [Gossypium mustelinum]TYJ37212.1 hypothetical protein E1A91_A05G361400v1 [Gossypium mustelinum]